MEEERWRHVLSTITVALVQQHSEQFDPVSVVVGTEGTISAKTPQRDSPSAAAAVSVAATDELPIGGSGFHLKASVLARDAASATEDPSVQSSGSDLLTAEGDGGASHIQWPDRVAHLERLSPCAKAVLGLGDAAHALTLTANGRAVQIAAMQGVLLETCVHRAAWLTGM